MGYNLIKNNTVAINGLPFNLKIVEYDTDNYIGTLICNEGVNIKFIWSYEAKSLQAVNVWINKVIKGEIIINSKYYENGFYQLPHNTGFGNPNKGERSIHIAS